LIESIYKRELNLRESPNIMKKRDYEYLLKERQVQKQKKNEFLKDRSLFGLFRRTFGF